MTIKTSIFMLKKDHSTNLPLQRRKINTNVRFIKNFLAINRTVENLKQGKAPGLDDICGECLKHSEANITPFFLPFYLTRFMILVVVFLSCPLVKKHADLSGSFLYSQSTMKNMYSKPTNRTKLLIPMKTKSIA